MFSREQHNRKKQIIAYIIFPFITKFSDTQLCDMEVRYLHFVSTNNLTSRQDPACMMWIYHIKWNFTQKEAWWKYIYSLIFLCFLENVAVDYKLCGVF